jgi:hypothetical protein
MTKDARDPPGWRLTFAVWESVRRDGWTPICKLAVLAAIALGSLVLVGTVFGGWSLLLGLAGVGAAVRRRRR